MKNKFLAMQQKQGFGTPYQRWLKTKLNSELIERITDSSFINKYNFNAS